MLFNTPLFREYPGTLVYLVPALRDANGSARLVAPPRLRRPPVPGVPGPDLARLTFFGFDLDPALGAERWVVLEETVNGRRFFNAVGEDEQRQATAPTSRAQTVSAPRRVLIRGDILLGGI